MKKKTLYAVLLSCALYQMTLAQGQIDTVIRIQKVEIIAGRIFNKEYAGMKETKVDSLILTDKINLSLSDLLSENTSVFVKYNGRGALASASFRGAAASHTQVNWNGLNINTPMAGMVDFSLIPVYIIDDLNLKHGTASITDKSGGLGGSINIANTVNWDKDFEMKYLQGIGSYSTFDEFLSIGGGNKTLQLKTRFYHNYSKNDYTFYNRGIGHLDPLSGKIINPLDTNNNADYTKYGLLQEIYWRANDKSVLSARYWGQWASRTIPRATSYEGPDNSNFNKQDDTDHKIVLDWKFYADKSKLLFRSGYAAKQLNYSLKNHIPGYGMIPAIYSRSSQRSITGKLSYTYDFNKSFSVEGNFEANLHNVISEDSVQKTGYEKERAELSAFLAVNKNIAGRLNLKFMLRQDWIDYNRMPVIPFFGFDFRIIREKDFLFRGNIARNYHQPSLNDMYWQPGGNPGLLPEEGYSAELGFEYQVNLKRNVIKTELTAYRSDIDNWIIWIPNYKGYWGPHNVKRVLLQGIEYNVKWERRAGKVVFNASGTYAYTRSINYGDPLMWGDDSYGKQLVYIPLHSGNLMINASYRGFFFTYQYNSYSERFTSSNNDLTRRDRLCPFFMSDAIIGKEFHFKRLSISAAFKIYNLLDETYYSVLYRPMPGRNYMFQLMIKL
ncbi:MAG: TonB-dependent receptor plug domain-containing protein [Bacteroidales bacterium]|nr:TonB-dependent receptor plug domain-containing protein [Bacteroidales bacterium]MBN2763601.1 TonB-dependent receptor plug domain-containing protein [Bacteroidales bacterium]